MSECLLTREFIESFEFRTFTKTDWMMWAGCDSPVPLIAERGDFLIIIDGDRCELYVEMDQDGPYEICHSISKLPCSR